MKINFVTLRQIKNWLSLFFIVAIIYFAFILLRSEVYRFNPQYLVDNTILKNRDFSSEVKEIKSPKLNLSAYLLEEHSNPIVSISFLFLNSGSAYDAPSRHGEAKLLSAMLTSGAGEYDMKKFQSILEQKAININFFSDYDNIGGMLKFIKKDMGVATRLFNLSITNPRIEEKYLEQNKNIIISNIKYQMEQVDSSLYVQSMSVLYGRHPYGRNPYGNIKHFANIKRHHLHHFLKKHLALDNLVIGISGDITEAEAKELIDKMFSGLPKHKKKVTLADVNVSFSAPTEHISRSSLQNIGSFWASGPIRQSPDFYPTHIASQILFGNGLGSRMYKKAREIEGLTYGIYGSLGENDKISFINGEFSATPDKFSRLLYIIKEEWRKIGEEGVTEQELEQTKNSLISSHALRYADIHNISDMLVYMQKEHLGLDFLQKRNDYIRNVNIESVNNAAKKYFTHDNLRFITIGNSYIEE